jgi:hypothetical protein
MNVRLQYTMNFTAGVHYHERMVMNNYMLKVFMITNTTVAENTTIAFERLKYFIAELDSTVFVNSEEQLACQQYIDAGIKITTLPVDPVDQIIGVMLFHKLNAIMEDRIIMVETELSSVLGDSMVYIHSENETAENLVIPEWWMTPDLVHCDTDLIDNDKVLAIHQAGAWRELDLGWIDTVQSDQTGNIVFADFKRDETE